MSDQKEFLPDILAPPSDIVRCPTAILCAVIATNNNDDYDDDTGVDLEMYGGESQDMEMNNLEEDDRKYHFKKHANLILLDSYMRNKGMLTSGRYKPNHFWDKVAGELESALQERGEDLFPSTSQCKYRYATMMKGYKKTIDNCRKSGNGRKPACKYFEQLDEINGQQPNIHPISTISSSGLGNINQRMKEKERKIISFFLYNYFGRWKSRASGTD